MLRILNIAVVILLVAAAGTVYRVKYEATAEAERIARLKLDIQRERESIADLRAQWARLNRPDRIQELAERHLSLRPLGVDQMHPLTGLPNKQIPDPDPIATMLEAMSPEGLVAPVTTGSVRPGGSFLAPLPPRRPPAGGR